MGVSPDVTAPVAAGAAFFPGLVCISPVNAGGVAALIFFDGKPEESGLRAVNADLVHPTAASLPASRWC